MANIFSTISMVCFVLSGMSFVGAIILFYVMNTKAAYLELKGKPQSYVVVQSRGEAAAETPTRKINVEDDAVTTILHPKLERSKRNV